MNQRRSHPKILDLPEELVQTVNNLLTDGTTYDDVVAFLKNHGHEISRSSVGRYGKNFLARLERLKVVRDQAKAIIDDNPDRPSTEVAEAANLLGTQVIMERLMELELDDLQGEKVTELLKALSQLERSAVSREKLKFEFTRGVDAATTKIKEALRKELASKPELMRQVIDLVDQTKEQIA